MEDNPACEYCACTLTRDEVTISLGECGILLCWYDIDQCLDDEAIEYDDPYYIA